MKPFALFFVALFVACCPARSPHSVMARDVEAKTVALVQESRTGETRAYCSGVWVSLHEIMTANHCVDDLFLGDAVSYLTRGDLGTNGADEVKTVREGKLIARDEAHDLALLYATLPPLHPVAVVASGAPYVGEAVQTEGHPLGLWYSYSSGEVSGVRQIDLLGLQPSMWWVQTTAPVSPGNSGGGLFNESGELLGIYHGYFPRGELLNIYVHPMYMHALLARQAS